jgi:hypothetical protein
MMTVKSKEKKIITESKTKIHILRNDGIPFDASLIEYININKSAVERRAATIVTRRNGKERMAGCMASESNFLYGFDYFGGR